MKRTISNDKEQSKTTAVNVQENNSLKRRKVSHSYFPVDNKIKINPKKASQKKGCPEVNFADAESDSLRKSDFINGDPNVHESKKNASFSISSFSATEFRKKLFTQEVGTELKVFSVLLEEKERDLAKEYFTAGGSASEILAAMSNVSKASPNDALAAFKILKCLFLRTIRDFPLKHLDSEEAAIKLLQSASPFLNSLLSSDQSTFSTSNKIKIVLNLLTAMVSLSARVASEVLFTINLDKDVVKQLTKPTGNSRAHFMHFLLAFLVDGDAHTIKLLLAKKGVLGTALLGLVHDPADLVHLVLTILRTKILENQGLSKFHKQNAFHTRVLESLVLLYEWQGPEIFKRDNRRKRLPDTNLVNPDDVNLVQEAVHSFLLLLLTSSKWGIVYSTKRTISTASKHNHHVFTVLRRVNKPWMSSMQGDLVIQVLRACPTLIRLTLSLYKEALAPRPTHIWLKTLDFTILVLSQISFSDALKDYEDNALFEAKELARVAEDISLPFSVLKAVLKPGLSYPHAAVREGCARLLTCVFESLSKHVEYVANKKLLPPLGVHTMKHLISSQLSKVAPTMSLIWSAWDLAIKISNSKHESIEPENTSQSKNKRVSISGHSSGVKENASKEHEMGDDMKMKIETRKIIPLDLLTPHNIIPLPIPDGLDEPDKITQLGSLLSLILGYQNWLPHWVEGSRHATGGSGLIKDIKELTVDIVNKKGYEVATILQLQCICLLSSFDSLIISPSQEIFPWALELLVKEARNNLYARRALLKLLSKLDVLQENPYELDLWFWGLEKGGEPSLSLMTRALVRIAKDPLTYTERRYEADKVAQNLEHATIAKQQLDEMLDDLEKEIDKTLQEQATQDNAYFSRFDLTFSPLILSALDEISEEMSKTKKCDLIKQQFVSSVLIRLLHQQTHPEPLVHVVLPSKKVLPNNVVTYIKGWVFRSQKTRLPKKLLSVEEEACEEHLYGEDNKEWMTSHIDGHSLRQLCFISTFHLVQATVTDILDEQLVHNTEEVMKFVLDNITSDLAQECLSFVLQHPLLVGMFSLRAKTTTACLVTRLLMRLTCEAAKLKDRSIVTALRQKTLHQITSRFAKHDTKFKLLKWCSSDEVLQFINNLLLERSELILVLDATCQLPVSAWIIDNISIAGRLAALMLNRLVDLRREVKYGGSCNSLALESIQVLAIVDKLIALIKLQQEFDFTTLENALYHYFELYPHHLGDLQDDLLHLLVQRSHTSSLNLAQFLLSRNPSSSSQLSSMVLATNASTLLPLVWAVEQSFPNSVDANVFDIMWKQLQPEVLQTIKEPSSMSNWLLANTDGVVCLLQKCLDLETSGKLVINLQKHKKLAYNEIHARMIKEVWLKVPANKETYIAWLLLSITHSLNTSTQLGLVSLLSKQLCESLKANENVLKLENQDDFLTFCKSALRSGVGGNIELLEAMSDSLLVYTSLPNLDEIWEMLLSHSQFLPNLLGSKHCLKIGVLKVMDCLTLRQPNLVNIKHVPLLLGIYSASLSSTDQLIIKLLQRYETNGVNFNDLKPLVWGEAAISRYALRSQAPSRLTLWNQPSANQVLQLLEQKRINATLLRFPLDRGLDEVTADVPPDSEVYDPAFLLPLLAQLLSSDMPVQAWRVTRQALGMCVMALASNKESTKIAAQLIVARLHYHLEGGRLTNETKSTLRFINMLRQSLYSAENDEMKSLPPLIGLFLAKATQAISHPKHPLYMRLNQFLLARQTIELDTVPELLRLVHDLEPDFRIHQLWILEVLKGGMRTEADFTVFCNSFTFKLLACLYSSSLADMQIKIEVLHIFATVVQIRDAAWRLCSSNGLLSWLRGAAISLSSSSVTDDSSSEHFAIFVTLLEKLWHAAVIHNQEKSKEFGFARQVAPSLTSILLLILPNMPAKDEIILSVVKTLTAICSTCPSICSFLSEINLKQLLQIAHATGATDLVASEDVLLFGCTYASKYSILTVDVTTKIRELIIMWKSENKN